jgi:putative serine protease PepD
MSVDPAGANGRDGKRWFRRPVLVVLTIPLGVAIAAGGGIAGYAIARSVTPIERQTVYCSSPAPTSSTAPAAPALTTAASVALPSVVAVSARSTDVGVTGSGIIISSDGVIVTNNHVVAVVAVNGGAVTVTFANGKKAIADVVGRAPDSDIAVIKARDVHGLRPAILGSAAGLAAGDQVLVIGTALGEPGTVTAGVISALNRSTCASGPTPAAADQKLYGTKPWLPEQLTLVDLIQTDAPISEGDSGGALVNTSGEVIGVCTAYTGSGVSSAETGVGFAIRIDVAYDIAMQLLKSS